MSKYTLAKEQIKSTADRAEEMGIREVEALEALVVMIVQELKEKIGPVQTKSILQYEVDNLGSGGVYEIQRR